MVVTPRINDGYPRMAKFPQIFGIEVFVSHKISNAQGNNPNGA